MHRAAAAAMAALPFGIAAGWLSHRSLLVMGEREFWMIFWLACTLQLWLLVTLSDAPTTAAQKSTQPQNGWVRVQQDPCAAADRVLAGLGACLVGGCALCQLGALGGLCLQLPAPWMAVWQGAAAAALIWVLLCLLAVACEKNG